MFSSRKLQVLLVIGFLLFFFLLRLPLGLVMGQLDPASGVSWQAVQGTVWRGQIIGLKYQQYEIGTADISAKPLPLLMGKLGLKFSIEGQGGSGDGQITLSRKTALLEQTDFQINLGAYPIRDAFGQKMYGMFSGAIDLLDISLQGCERGNFSVETDALATSLKRVGEEGFLLSGQGRCEEGDLILPLAGAGPAASVDIETLISPNLSYRATVTVLTQNRQLTQGLQAVGFDNQAEGLRLTQVGNFITRP